MSSAQPLIISVSGIRGIIGQGLTPTAATAFALALGEHARGGRIVLSRDGRPSGVDAAPCGAGRADRPAGCDVQDLGVVPTATVGLAVKQLQAAGGIQITASHNPRRGMA